MRDAVEFCSPAGPLGRLVDRLVMTMYKTRLLERRNAGLGHALAVRDADDVQPPAN